MSLAELSHWGAIRGTAVPSDGESFSAVMCQQQFLGSACPVGTISQAEMGNCAPTRSVQTCLLTVAVLATQGLGPQVFHRETWGACARKAEVQVTGVVLLSLEGGF